VTDSVSFTAGGNIAMKVPPDQWEETVAFYRDVVGLDVLEHEPTDPPSVGFRFGANKLWVDRVQTLSQAEIWLELNVDDVDAAASRLQAAGISRRDEIEPLGETFNGFWVASPASIIHLVALPGQSGY
jgi:catechol 2,3-dioxygenase-like lactoylglutathione lyase family enzyme